VSEKGGLTERELSQVRELADTVRDVDGVDLKLDWDQMTATPLRSEVSNFYHSESGRLIGYAQLDGGGSALEVTAAVFPAFRRRGVFRRLLDSVREETRRRGAGRLLLVNYRASQSGVAAVRALGLPYLNSEYRMEADSTTISSLPAEMAGTIRLVRVGAAEVLELARLLAATSGSEWRSPEKLAEELERPGVRYFLAERGGERIGHIGVIDVEDSIYIRAVGILPEQRRRGYGRRLLAATLQAMQAEGYTRFSLDVATENVRALSLYESCGFHTTNIYDYHDVLLTPAERETDRTK